MLLGYDLVWDEWFLLFDGGFMQGWGCGCSELLSDGLNGG